MFYNDYKYEEAVSSYKEALNGGAVLSGDNHGRLGISLIKLTNNIEEGVFHYRMAIALKADYEAIWYYNLAGAL